MRLIDTDTYELVDLEHKPRYAILSHRWVANEITYQTYQPALLDNAAYGSPGSPEELSVRKIRGACAVAKRQEIGYIWIDNCCIDKRSSEELRTALNSMFTWYHEAAVCYTYLGDVTFTSFGRELFDRDPKDGDRTRQPPSVWFERGWTLQELLAPRRMEFYDKNWDPMDTRHNLADAIGEITRIDPEYLRDEGSEKMQFRSSASVATRMSWMAGRTTREIEDIAYSLLGILDVSMVPMYGEKEKAFSRLQETIMTDSHAFDESLFAWQVPPAEELNCYMRLRSRPESKSKTIKGSKPSEELELIKVIPTIKQDRLGLLAPSPDCFLARGRQILVEKSRIVRRLGSGFQKTHQGVSVTLPLRETKSTMTGRDRKDISLPLNCWIGTDNVVLELKRDPDGLWNRTQGNKLESKRGAKVGNNKVLGIDQGGALLGQVTVAQPPIQLAYPK